MAAAPASPLNHNTLSVVTDFFATFGVKRRFGLDKSELEKRFYALSRELHPDRFATAEPAARQEALQKMSLVNEAYRTLKNPELLRDYFLKLVGVTGDAKAQIPVDLAESWFEIQEALMEDDESAPQKLQAFKTEVKERKASKENEIATNAQAIDRKLAETSESALAPDFQKLAALVRDLNYLESMLNDIERKAAQFG